MRDWLVAGLALAAFGLAALAYLHRHRQAVYHLSLSAGSPVEFRSHLAALIAQEARKHGLDLEVRATAGSEESFQEVNAGTLDLALAQGGLGHDDQPNVRQVTDLNIEPMHLLVKASLYSEVSKNLWALRGKSVNINKTGSGTHWLALDTLRFAGLMPRDGAHPGDFVESSLSQTQLLEETDTAKLPDAVFLVTTLPSNVARRLVQQHNYRLVPLPFAEAFSLDAFSPDLHPERHTIARDVDKGQVYDAVIPAFTYGIEPESVPPEPLHTLGTRLLLVAHKNVDPEAIARLLQLIYTSKLAHLTRPLLTDQVLSLPPELPLHAGTLRYLERSKPLITGDIVDFLEKATTIGAPILGGVLFLWQWFRHRYRRLRDEGFEHYIFRVTEIERRALQLEMGAMLELRALVSLQQELGQLKTEALGKFVSGELEGEELMSGFLAHVNDARDYLARLLLHERANLEEEAKAQGVSFKSLWNEALSGRQGAPPAPADPGSAADYQNSQARAQNT